jgi:hypothetical protein
MHQLVVHVVKMLVVPFFILNLVHQMVSFTCGLGEAVLGCLFLSVNTVEFSDNQVQPSL